MPTQTIMLPESDAASRLSPTIHRRFAERVALMESAPLFAGLVQPEYVEIASFALVRTFDRGEILFAQGESIRYLILLRSGSVIHTQVSKDGKEALLRMIGVGEVVNAHGEDAIGHSCSARAVERCDALVWEYSRMVAFWAKRPQLRRNFRDILVARLEELEERFREVATEKVATRLALAILRLRKQVGKPSNEGIQVLLSREELAQMTGATVFTISRLLARWSEQGVIIARRRAVVIRDATRLQSVIEVDSLETRKDAPGKC